MITLLGIDSVACVPENKTRNAETPSEPSQPGIIENPPVAHISKFLYLKNGFEHEITGKNKYEAAVDTPLDVFVNDNEKQKLKGEIIAGYSDDPFGEKNGENFSGRLREKREEDDDDERKKRRKKFKHWPILCG